MLYEIDSLHALSAPSESGFEISDETLMAGIQRRCEEDLAALCRRHTARLRTIMARVVNNDTDVDDLLQEVFVEVWNRAGTYDPAKGKALGWIITLARRRAIDRLRKKLACTRAEERLREASRGDADANRPPAADGAAQGDVAEIFQRLLATLPPAQREAVQLAYYAGLSQRDIARRTGIPLGTIKTRLELAVRKLRAAILALGGETEWHLARATPPPGARTRAVLAA